MEVATLSFTILALCGQTQQTAIRFTDPTENRPIVLTDSEGMATISGEVDGSMDRLYLEWGQSRLEVPVHGGKWSARVLLEDGPDRIKVVGGPFVDVWVTRGQRIKKRGRLRVTFEWSPQPKEGDCVKKLEASAEEPLRQIASAEDRLREIAEKTLDNPPEHVDAFIDAVKTEAKAFYFGQAFAGLNVEPLEAGPGPEAQSEDIYRVLIYGEGGVEKKWLGSTLHDCWHELPRTNCSHVYLDHMAAKFVEWVEKEATPMRRTDPWELRAQDVAYCLARTAAHETGHGLMLVGVKTEPHECAWMGGINELNHHGRIEEGKQLDRRYGGGLYLMDCALLFKKRYRIGEPYKGRRAGPKGRLPLEFSAFDLAYLRLLYPLE